MFTFGLGVVVGAVFNVFWSKVWVTIKASAAFGALVAKFK